MKSKEALDAIIEYLSELEDEDEKPILEHAAEYAGEFDGEEWNVKFPCAFVEIVTMRGKVTLSDGYPALLSIRFNIYIGGLTDETNVHPLEVCDIIWSEFNGEMGFVFEGGNYRAKAEAQNLYSKSGREKAYVIQCELFK